MKRKVSNIHRVLKNEFNSPSAFKKREEGYVKSIKEIIEKESGIIFDLEELSELLLSVCRSNDFNVIKFQGNKVFWVNPFFS